MRLRLRDHAILRRSWAAGAALAMAAAVLSPGAAGASPADGTPFGNVDGVAWTTGNEIRVTGWAADADYPESWIQVHIYVDGVPAVAVNADGDRPDVAAAFPGYSATRGFDQTLEVSRGAHDVCVYAINLGIRGANALLGCRGVEVGRGPIGTVDSWGLRAGGVAVTGWALDPDTTDPIDVHVYVDGALAAVGNSVLSRPDVDAAFGRGALHGFTIEVPVAVGDHQVCAYGIDVTGDANRLLRCLTVSLTGDPFFSLDDTEPAPGGARITGWIIDPDTVGPSRLDLYVNGVFTSLPANTSRPDVGAAYPGYGDNHGVDGFVAVPLGLSTICAYAINVAGPGANIGECRLFEVLPG